MVTDESFLDHQAASVIDVIVYLLSLFSNIFLFCIIWHFVSMQYRNLLSHGVIMCTLSFVFL